MKRGIVDKSRPGPWLLACFVPALVMCLAMLAVELPKHYDRDGWVHTYRLVMPVELQWPSLQLTPDDADD